ncbi:unnamed protein product, partial [Sphacelaria rigidula]
MHHALQAVKYYTVDSGIALFVAFLINLAVVSTFARHFYAPECATAEPTYGTCEVDGTGVCQEIGLSAAAEALKGTLGASAKYIWAVG